MAYSQVDFRKFKVYRLYDKKKGFVHPEITGTSTYSVLGRCEKVGLRDKYLIKPWLEVETETGNIHSLYPKDKNYYKDFAIISKKLPDYVATYRERLHNNLTYKEMNDYLQFTLGSDYDKNHFKVLRRRHMNDMYHSIDTKENIRIIYNNNYPVVIIDKSVPVMNVVFDISEDDFAEGVDAYKECFSKGA